VRLIVHQLKSLNDGCHAIRLTSASPNIHPILKAADPQQEEFRREPLDGRAARRLLDAFRREVVRFYPSWSPAVGPTADPQEFEAPQGAFLIAYLGDEAVGCGGFKRFDAQTAEIKRMFVSPEARGRGLGRRILEQLEAGARAAGYVTIRLDTGDRLPAAIDLYRSAGYREIPDYNGNPSASHWFEKSLR
jgi:GNAT superfamily N-acetyltransferase